MQRFLLIAFFLSFFLVFKVNAEEKPVAASPAIAASPDVAEENSTEGDNGSKVNQDGSLNQQDTTGINPQTNENTNDIFGDDGVRPTTIDSEQNLNSLTSSGLFTSYLVTIGVLLLILGVLAYVSTKLKNRTSLPKLNLPFGSLVKQNRSIKIVEKYVLEPRKTLYIVNVGRKNWLIGSSETALNLLTEVEIDEDITGETIVMDKKENTPETTSPEGGSINIKKTDAKGKSFSDYLNLPVFIPLLFAFIGLILWISPVNAQDMGTSNFLDSIDLRAPVQLKEFGTPIQLIIFMAFLTLLPFFFIMTTSFMRTIIVLGFLRQAIGTQQIPPNQVILGISIFLTIYIMSPVWSEVNNNALTPYLDNKISQSVAFERGVAPIRNFMLKYTKKEELAFFMRIVKLPQPKTAEDVPLHVLIPAYMVSELATGFKIGFFLFLPFLVVDLVVANTLLALGMMMLSPVTISMPFKLLVFTLANGWYLVLQALVTSFKL